MDLTEFDYELPQELIAQHPVSHRDESRLLVVNRAEGAISQTIFKQIVPYFEAGDLLVLNNTHVFPARLFGKKSPGGAAIEMLLLQHCEEDEWEVIAYRASRLKVGTVVVFSNTFQCEVKQVLDEGKFRVCFSYQGDWNQTLREHGQIPLPPYIRRDGVASTADDDTRYQTIFHKPNIDFDSAAAPTAGLHFSRSLLDELQRKGVQLGYVTLRIGLDTFLPMRVDRVEDHRMHTEMFHIPSETAELVNQTRAKGKRIVAVGTTSVRVLESAVISGGQLREQTGATSLFIYPGYAFQLVDAMITNFHLPKSTLLLLVSAFMGNDLRIKAYEYAMRERFRFYSYGDAMLIL